MASFVEHSGSIYNEDDDFFSEISTIKCYSIGNPNKIPRYINSATYVENEIFRSGEFDSNSNSDNEGIYDDICNTPKYSLKKICRIDESPEAEEKRRKAYANWLKAVNEREKERKRLEKERIEAQCRMKAEIEESKKLKNDEKVREWNERKLRETQKKISRLNESRHATEKKVNEPKEFKKAIKFEEWVAKKNEEFKALKAQQEKEKNKLKEYVKTRESISAITYKKWMQTSKNVPKPVPLNRGLESLQGSTTKLYVNPIAWKSLNE